MRILLPIASCMLVLPFLHAQAELPRGRPALAQVLAGWQSAFATGRLELAGMARTRGKTHPLYGRGWLPGGQAGADLSHRHALRELLARARRQGEPGCLLRILQLACLRLPPAADADRRGARAAVRNLCLLALQRFDRPEDQWLLMQAVRGAKFWSGRRPPQHEACRRFALRVLARMGRRAARPRIEARLADAEPAWRLAAAEGLGEMMDAASIRPICVALAQERDATVAQALVQAVVRIIQRRGAAVPARELRAAALTAIDVLGRCDWRVDLDLVGLLDELRTAAAVPALIEVLARWQPDAPAAAARLRSGLLRQAAYLTLRSLTGAVIARDDIDGWRKFWDEQGASLVVAAKRAAADPTRTKAGFFGIPVQGSNVVFIIDLSGSMAQRYVPVGDYKPDSGDGGASRLEVACHELKRSLRGLERGTNFNLVEFAALAKVWQPRLVPVNSRNRQRLAARIDRLNPGGATNIHAALTQALELRAARRGARYGVAVDEIFLLSDGAPSAGAIQDPKGILEAVRAANRYLKVRINALYMGGGNSDFMRRLASQNGGRYVAL